MILLDTHIWIWWVHGDPHLAPQTAALLEQNEPAGLGVSIISCWEIAKLVQVGRLALPCSVSEWLNQALAYPGIVLHPLSPGIIVESTHLPGSFHRDPADQLIVATARILGCPLVTADDKIRAYEYVVTLPKPNAA